MKKYLSVIALFLLALNDPAFSAVSSSPQLVNQPAYNSMSFYVYKPAGLAGDFYVTYDGYLVYKDVNGIWYYGSSKGGVYTKTQYVVGSVIPSVVGLGPFNANTATVAPILPQNSAVYTPPSPPTFSGNPVQPQMTQLTPSGSVVYVPPSSPAGLATLPQTSFPAAQSQSSLNSNFMAVSRWSSTVDRIGVLNKPAIPVAWKGDYPDVVYAWNGQHWKQLNAKGKKRPLNIIRSGIYDLTVETNKLNALHWTNNDSYVLSQYAAMWGYQWLGQIVLGR